MKFIKLESRGGNYLVVAENVAWLRTAENGQTSVGIIGGQPLLVVGSIEEVAEKILSATAAQEEPAASPAQVAELSPPVVTAAAPAPPVPEPVLEPEPGPEPALVAPPPLAPTEPVCEAIAPEPANDSVPAGSQPEPETASERAPPPAVVAVAKPAASAPPRPAPSVKPAPTWERPAKPAGGLKIKAGSQRMMGRFD
ncbi:hypothetical protein CHX26_10815 [Porphyrobacter sp. HT-58-2]|uniref:hypothetical protein n=1 Tax=Porphyrobacter sp. HT-58-2 TaxID=2023229 RepID=UPI000CDCA203|nr:hypothetical protein [Porphyrobacter sp. HT-58-2]AUX69916.1 hypothetical protein CHX26_10815 [Porphyrobacter sp. HT-58-2]